MTALPKRWSIFLDKQPSILTDLATIKRIAGEKENENDAFREFLRHRDSSVIDKMVHALNDAITPQIDCTRCGNCCKSLMINVTAEEAIGLAAHLNMDMTGLKEKYLEVSPGGKIVINTIPCHFLQNTKCGIYEHRFEGCREFPHLDKANFTHRLFGTLMYYGTCPIIFNVVEQLKEKTGFRE